MKEKNISNYEMSKKTGISDSLIGYWRKGERIPKADNLIIVANFLECSTDYLLGRTPENHSVDFSGNGNIVHGSVVNSHSGNNSSLTINANSTDNTTSNDEELLKLFHKLSFVKQAEIIVKMNEMQKDGEVK